MEIKTHVLLLSLLVITGAVTADAYAQSNTERLATIADDTSEIKSISESISEMVSSISDAIEGIAASITSMQSTLLGVNTSVDEVKSSVAMLSSDVTSIKSSINGFSSIMPSITGLSEQMASVEMRLTNIETSMLNNQNTGSTDIAVQILAEKVNKIDIDMESIKASLAAISTKLEVVQKDITTPPTKQPTGYFEGTSKKAITDYDYQQYGKKSTVNNMDYYDLDLTFSCNADVFLDTSDMTKSYGKNNNNQQKEYLERDANYDRDNPLGTDDINSATTKMTDGVNYIKVDGRILYQNDFAVNTNNHIELDKSETFVNRLLTAGNALTFETRIYDGVFGNYTDATSPGDTNLGEFDSPNTDNDDISSENRKDMLIKDAMKNTRDNKGLEIELYSVEVSWNSFNAATCSIGIGGAPSAVGADTPYTNTFGAAVTGDGLLKSFSNTLDCGGNPLTITGITTGTGADDSLATYGKLYLTIDDGTVNKVPDVSYKFGDKWVLDLEDNSPKDLPLTVSGHDVIISGTIPADSLIVELSYNSIPNAGCTVEPTS